VVFALVVAGKVLRAVAAAVLPGDDMVDVEAEERLVLLAEAAVLAALARPLADQPARRGIHQGFAGRRRAARAFACRMARKLPKRTAVSYSSRSSGVSRPSLHLSASSSMRA